MDQLRINATIRQRQAKGDNRRLRVAGLIPGVIYGGKGEPITVSINHHELEMILRGARRSSAVFNLAIGSDGATEQTILREVQRHPVTSRMIHADFQRVDLTEEIEVTVPVHAVGKESKGVHNGGILEHVTRMVDVRTLPLNVPKFLEADLSELDVNQSFHVSDLKLPEGIIVINEPETALFTILAPKGEAEPVVGAAEPEIIGGKKPAEETK